MAVEHLVVTTQRMAGTNRLYSLIVACWRQAGGIYSAIRYIKVGGDREQNLGKSIHTWLQVPSKACSPKTHPGPALQMST